MKPGIYDLSNREYHESEGISRSGISELKKSPLQYWEKYENPVREKEAPTKSMVIGSAVHTLALEPHLFDQEFIVPLKVDMRTNEGKRYKSEFEVASIGRQVITQEDYVQANNIAQEIIDHPKFVSFKDGAEIEKSFYWIDEETGLLCKTRPDILNRNLKVLCDIKTSNDPSPEWFSYVVRTYDYHIQAAMQIDGVFNVTGEKIDYFTFLAAPTKRPHKPYLYVLEDPVIELGRKEYKSALKVLKACREKNCWDLDRNRPIPINFNEFQLANDPFFNLKEVYQCQQK